MPSLLTPNFRETKWVCWSLQYLWDMGQMLIKSCSRLLDCLSIIPPFQVVNEAWGGWLACSGLYSCVHSRLQPQTQSLWYSFLWGWSLLYFTLPNPAFKGWVSIRIRVIKELENWKKCWGFTFWIRCLQDHRKWNPVCLVLQNLDLVTQCWAKPNVMTSNACLFLVFSIMLQSLFPVFLVHSVFCKLQSSYGVMAQQWQKSTCWQCHGYKSLKSMAMLGDAVKNTLETGQAHTGEPNLLPQL